MALNIKNAETEKLARELARRRNQSITQVLTEALRKEVERERRKRQTEDFSAFSRGIDEIVARVKRLPVLEDRSADEMLGCKHGAFD